MLEIQWWCPIWGFRAVTMLGAYELAEGLVEQISTWSPLTPTTNTISSGGMRLTLQGNAFFSGSPSSPRVRTARNTHRVRSPSRHGGGRALPVGCCTGGGGGVSGA